MNIKKKKKTRARGSQQVCISTETRNGGRRATHRENEDDSGSASLKLHMCYVPSRLTATLSPYQTFQRQRGWLQALCGWSWNSMFCTAVITSASHKEGRALQQQQHRALCLSSCTPKKVPWHFIHMREETLIPPLHFHFFYQPSVANSQCRVTELQTCSVGLGQKEVGEATRPPLGGLLSVWEITSPGWFSIPLSKEATLTYGLPMTQEGEGSNPTIGSCISPLRGTGPK